jgi:hypothetical protein
MYMHAVPGVERIRPDERILLQQRFGGGTTLGRRGKSQVGVLNMDYHDLNALTNASENQGL